jgi:dimethylargininase
MFTDAIVRLPGANFADGLTTVDLGLPRFELVLEQHARYCEALRDCGLAVTTVAADLAHPDSTFVEDTAVLTERGAILMRPGAASRVGESEAIRETIGRFFPALPAIGAPGTVDGGDICEAGEHFFIGLSNRTNDEGARQLANHLAKLGYTSSVVDVRALKNILHLKSGISYLGENTIVVIEEMAHWEVFQKYEPVVVSMEESYAANCVRVNQQVLVAHGYPRIQMDLERRGFKTVALDMSEFRKMDGGLSCLSLRF